MEQARIEGSGLLLALLPLAGAIFSRPVTDLLNVSRWPLLLMLLFAPLTIGGDTAVDNLISPFEVVLVGISWV